MIPHFYQGEIVGYVNRPSDSLLRYVLEKWQARNASLSEARHETDDECQELVSLRAQLRKRLQAFAAQDGPDHEPDDETDDAPAQAPDDDLLDSGSHDDKR